MQHNMALALGPLPSVRNDRKIDPSMSVLIFGLAESFNHESLGCSFGIQETLNPKICDTPYCRNPIDPDLLCVHREHRVYLGYRFKSGIN